MDKRSSATHLWEFEKKQYLTHVDCFVLLHSLFCPSILYNVPRMCLHTSVGTQGHSVVCEHEQ